MPFIYSCQNRLPKIGGKRSKAAPGRDDSPSPSESTFADNAHLSKYTERFIFEDDNDNATSSNSRLPSLQMNRVLHDDGIWNDKQVLGVGASGLGNSSTTSYLHRYLQMSDDDSFPTMVRKNPSNNSCLSYDVHSAICLFTFVC